MVTSKSHIVNKQEVPVYNYKELRQISLIIHSK